MMNRTTYRWIICRSKRLVWLLFAVAALLVVNLGTASGQHTKARLTIREAENITGKYPGSVLYIAALTNESTIPLQIEAVQMPGGYIGSGRFFPCALQEWDSRRNRWIDRSNTLRSDFGAGVPIKLVELNSGSSVDVCRAMLPHEASKPCSKVRFALRFTWVGKASAVSAPFYANGEKCKSDEK